MAIRLLIYINTFKSRPETNIKCTMCDNSIINLHKEIVISKIKKTSKNARKKKYNDKSILFSPKIEIHSISQSFSKICCVKMPR